MDSLHDIAARHGPLLLLDAASALVQVGVVTAAGEYRWAASAEEAGTGLFRALESLAFDVNAAGALAICEGPGSVLGIRTSAVALRTWAVLRPRPMFVYRSLELVAHAAGRPGLSIIADARRQSWHVVRIAADGAIEPLRRVPAAELAAHTGPLATPAEFRHWTPRPDRPLETVAYDLAELWPRADHAPLLRATTGPDAYQPAEPSYVTWTPHVHRAPTPSTPSLP